MFKGFDASLDRQRQRHESLPLPLRFSVFLESLLRDEQAETATRIVAGAFLVMVGASLRLSDIMHIRWNELNMDSLDLREVVYRTKMARSGMLVAVAGDVMLGFVVDYQGRACPAILLMLLFSVWRETRDCLGLTSCQMSCFSLGTYLLRNSDHRPVCKRSKSYVTCRRSTCRNVRVLLVTIRYTHVKQHIYHACHSAIWGGRTVACTICQRQYFSGFCEVLRRVSCGWLPAMPIARGGRDRACVSSRDVGPHSNCATCFNILVHSGLQLRMRCLSQSNQRLEIWCMSVWLDPVAKGSGVSDVDVTRAVVPSVP